MSDKTTTWDIAWGVFFGFLLSLAVLIVLWIIFALLFGDERKRGNSGPERLRKSL